MKNISLLFVICLAFTSWTTQAQHLEIELNSSSSSNNPHIFLKEAQSNDFARLRIQSINGSPNFWEMAGRTGDNNDFNFYFDSEDLSGNVLSMSANNKRIRVGSSSLGIDLDVFGSTDVAGNLDVDGTTNLDATNIVGLLDVNGDIEAGENLTLDPPSLGDPKITFIAEDNNNEATIEFKEGTLNNIDLEIKNNSGAGSIEIFTGGGTTANWEMFSSGSIRTLGGNFGVGRIAGANTFEVEGNAGKTMGGTTWVNLSDRRLKKDIHNFKEGLDVLMKIRPVWFKYNGKVGTDPDEQEVGIIAQEVQEIAPYMIGEFVHKKEEHDEGERYLSYNSNALQYILVNAIQEHQKEIEEKSNLIEAQSKEIVELKSRLDRIEQLLQKRAITPTIHQHHETLNGTNLPRLEQNAPNPFDGQTQIQYFVPTDAQQAHISVHDQNGKVLKSFPLTDIGSGQLNLNLKNFPNGVYSYSLKIDGQVVETKQMIQAK